MSSSTKSAQPARAANTSACSGDGLRSRSCFNQVRGTRWRSPERSTGSRYRPGRLRDADIEREGRLFLVHALAHRLDDHLPAREHPSRIRDGELGELRELRCGSVLTIDSPSLGTCTTGRQCGEADREPVPRCRRCSAGHRVPDEDGIVASAASMSSTADSMKSSRCNLVERARVMSATGEVDGQHRGIEELLWLDAGRRGLIPAGFNQAVHVLARHSGRVDGSWPESPAISPRAPTHRSASIREASSTMPPGRRCRHQGVRRWNVS